ncbi:OpgC domain-containing protein, partial [Mesorhizobium sp. M7A.F.Ca.MR.362.00.0.0]|uniref:OpgC domain-containing protein n=1 Tax=Mesorhizobium sp. M7A.F.Ca.MR.362.00.0.0 TaxID=2496779 RepID=UPI000FD2E281
LAVSYLIVAFPAVSNLFRTGRDHPLAILGKRSLPVFIAGTVLAMAAQVLKLINPGGFAYDSLLISAGIVMQFALAYYLEWLSGLAWSGKSRPAHNAAPPVHAASFAMPAMATRMGR